MVLIHHNREQEVHENVRPLILFSPKWDLLGPFQIGTREASWGADPLERLGGFHNLQPDQDSVYASSLAAFGRVKWTHCPFKIIQKQTHAIEIALNITFPDIDWSWLQQVYGWAALQYQAWARGELVINGQVPQIILLYTDKILEVWVDDEHYFGGDYYAYRHAPLVLHLCPGAHKIELRLIRDVRIMGGTSPSMSIALRAERSEGLLVVLGEKLVVSDLVNGTIASPYAAIPLRNDGKYVIKIHKIEAVRKSFKVRLLDDSCATRLAAGQIRSIPLFVTVLGVSADPLMVIRVIYTTNEAPETYLTSTFHRVLTKRDVHEPHKVTFLHPSRFVSYAILRAPSKNVIKTIGSGQSLPIHLNLHGAGLEAESDQVRHMLDPVPDLRAFVLFPTGVTPWSSDDWHDWGFADVRAAIASISTDWVAQVQWDGPFPDGERWLVSGHSNGGQGALHALTHHPDKIIGAAPVSGYLSIQKYVPYHTWHEAESQVTQVIQNSLQSFRHELLIRNFQGLPLLIQHGSKDDNVPAFHSRRLLQLVSQNNEVDDSKYVEIQGEGHWYKGVMTTFQLIHFYEKCLAGNAKKPTLPQSFEILVANPADMTTRGGLRVDQLVVPSQLGKIKVTCDKDSAIVYCETVNIRRFHFVAASPLIRGPTRLSIDGQRFSEFPVTEKKVEKNQVKHFLYLINRSWTISQDSQWQYNERYGRQLGPLHAILHTQDRFRIQCLSTGAAAIALQISRNLYQYFRADADIVEGSDTTCSTGNLITVSVGTGELPNASVACPAMGIDGEGGVVLRSRDGSLRRRHAPQEGLGAIFLRPLANENLELVIWGIDQTGLRLATRLFPMLTGVGQPEFVVVKKCMGWEGAAGALAMGSFDNYWQVSEGSFLQ